MRSTTLSALALGALVALPSLAHAQTAVYDWPDPDAPVLVATKGSLVFLHKDGTPFRTYSWKSAKKDALIVTDIDGDDAPELLAVGKPTFSLETSTEPRWFQKKGCPGAVVGNFMADGKRSLACVSKRKVRVYTHDLQFAWELDPGRGIKGCVAGDLNNDGRDDLECAISSSRVVHIDGEGSVINADTDDKQLDGSPAYEALAPAGLAATTYDFDQDGTAEESVSVEDGGFVHVVSKSSPKAFVTENLKSEVESVLVKDIDGDGTLEVIAASSKAFAVMRPKDKSAKVFPTSAKKYRRAPVAELQSVYANNFTDDAAAQASVNTLESSLAKCYASQAKKSGLAGSGQLLMEVFVDDSAKITRISKLHSDIPDKKVVSCVQKALKKAKPPAANDGAEAAINVTLRFSFRDSAK